MERSTHSVLPIGFSSSFSSQLHRGVSLNIEVTSLKHRAVKMAEKHFGDLIVISPQIEMVRELILALFAPSALKFMNPPFRWWHIDCAFCWSSFRIRCIDCECPMALINNLSYSRMSWHRLCEFSDFLAIACRFISASSKHCRVVHLPLLNRRG